MSFLFLILGELYFLNCLFGSGHSGAEDIGDDFFLSYLYGNERG